MTLAQMQVRIRSALGLKKADGFAALPNSVLTHLINEAQREVRLLLRDRIKPRFTDFEGTRAERLPDNFLVDVECWTDRDVDTGFQGYRIVPVPYRELVTPKTRFDPDNPATGRPQRYSIIASDKSPDSYTTRSIRAGEYRVGEVVDGQVIRAGQQITVSSESTNAALIYFDPIPTAGVRFDLFYVPLPTEMEDATDEPDFDGIYHETVLAKAREKVALEIGDFARFTAMAQAALPLLAQHRIIANQRRSGTIQTRISY